MPRVTLSFDNGPDKDITPRVLEILARHGIKSCFFVLGRKLADPSLRKQAERAHAEGHWIGNHTWSHETPLGRLDGEDVPEREIAAAQREIGSLAHPRRWFRPFGGGGRIGPWLLSEAARDHLIAGGYSMVLWNSIPRDWEDADGWVERALEHCAAQPWTLVVLHDHIPNAAQYLDRFIGALKDRGAELRQDFPEDCVPIRDGRPALPLDGYVQS